MKKNWTLIKPENDFFALEDELRNLYFAVRTYELFGTRSPYAGVTDYSPSFELLEKIVSGEKNYVFWEPNELIYDTPQNVYSVEDAKKLWSLVVVSTMSSMLFYIEKIRLHSTEFNSYPIWLKTRCEFACNKFMPLFRDYLRKDVDCGYLADRLIMPLEVNIPTKLPDSKF